jgi:hypothetical protein
MKFKIYFSLIIAVVCGFSACDQKQTVRNKPEIVPLPETKIHLQVQRFDQEIFEHQGAFDSTDILTFRKKYGRFFDLWCIRLAGILSPTDIKAPANFLAYNLNQYVKDPYIREVYLESKKQYDNIDGITSDLDNAFTRYKVCFPKQKIPDIITYLSPFTSNVMTMDQHLGVGLHFYLGANYKYYPSLKLPKYMSRKFSKEWMVSDMIKGWLTSDFENDSAHQNLLNEIIEEGKILYAMDLLLPDLGDSLKIGYTSKQFDWATTHEGDVWAFFLEQQLLYGSNPKIFMKFINDGNGTNGFPKEAPAKLGSFIGWQIVRSFMKEHPQLKVNDLFLLHNSQLILTESGYKPAKRTS